MHAFNILESKQTFWEVRRLRTWTFLYLHLTYRNYWE